MIEITRLGVGIDPTDAEQGAKRAVAAAESMGRKMPPPLDKVEKRSRRTGKAVKESGDQMQKAARQTGAEFDKLGKNTGFSRLLQGFNGSMSQLRSMVINALDALGLLNGGIGSLVRRGDSLMHVGEQANKSFKGLGGSAASAGTGIAGLAARFGPLLAILAAVAVAIGGVVIAFKTLQMVAGLAMSALGAAGPVQRTEQSLRTLIGSATEATRVMEQLRSQSRKTGADLEGSSNTTKRFIALGFTPDDALQLNRSILDVAGAVGMSRTEASLLGQALAQVQAKGVVSMEELRQQIAEKGIPVIEELAKKLGVTTGALIKMVEKSEVSSKELIDIFLNMEGGFARFSGGAEQMTKTLPGAIDRIRAIWNDLLIDIGKPVAEAITPMINQLSNFLETFKPLAVSAGQAIGNAFKVMHQAISSGAVGQFLALTLMAGYEQAVSWWIQIHIRAVLGLGNALVQGLTSAFTLGLRIFTTLFTFNIKLITGLLTGNLNQGIMSAANTMKSGFVGVVKYIGVAIYNSFGQALENVSNAFLNSMLAVVNTIGGAINQILDAASSLPVVGGAVTGSRIPTASATGVDFFSPLEMPDLGAAVDNMVGTGARDLAGQNAAKLLAEWNKANPMPVTPPMPAGIDPKLDPTGGGGADAANATTKALEEQKSALQGLIEEWGNLAKQSDQALTSLVGGIAGEFSSALTDAISGTKSWSQAFEELGASVVRQIIQMVTQLWVQYTVSMMLKNVMGSGILGGGGGGILGGLFSNHSGGTSEGAPVRGGVRSLPRFHSGGKASSERLAMLESNETVLTAEQGSEIRDRLRSSGSGGGKKKGGQGTAGTEVTIMNVTDASQVAEAIAGNPSIILNAINSQLPVIRQMVQSGNRM